jgi:hypothetical protein
MTTAELANNMRDDAPVQEQHPAAAVDNRNAPLFPEDQVSQLRMRWHDVQGHFVDDPRSTVQQADELVAETIRRLAEVFAAEKDKMEQTWSRGDNVDTEVLRQAFQRYRSFFDRLLSA